MAGDEIDLAIDEDKKVPLLKEEDITVVNDDDQPIETAKVEEGKKPVEIPVELGIDELKSQLEESRNKQRIAEAEAAEARRAAEAASSEAQDTNLLLIDGAIEAVKRDQAVKKAAYRDALQMGDYDKAAEINEQMVENASKVLQLERGKTEYEARARQPKNSDVVEQFASRLSPRSADWVRKHPEYVTDQRLNQKMVAAHNLAVADGIKADTDEYFSYVEGILKVESSAGVQRAAPKPADPPKREEEAVSDAGKETKRRDSPPPAAPGSGRAATNNGNPNVIRLTAAERETARDLGMTEKEYALNKAQLIKEGRLN